MRVRVLFFAIIRDAARIAETEVEVPESASVKDAIASAELEFPQIRPYLSRAAVAVNRQYASQTTLLAEGDEVAIIPPVSGG
jgi:molybdopterin converting factor subunit 1